MARSESEFAILSAEDTTMAEAVKALEELSQDTEATSLAEARAEAVYFHDMGMAMSREDGKAEGMEQGVPR